MANMYPPTIEDAHGSKAERQVFAQLERNLSNEFYCYHSKSLLVPGRHGLREGEIDFVILHSELGLLALEIKGGGLMRDGRGRWYRIWSGGREPLRKDPFAQARDNLHALVELLRKRLAPVLPEWKGALRLAHGHAVCVPDVTVGSELSVPSGMAPELLLDAAVLEDVERYVREAMKAWAGDRRPPPAREFKRFRKHVLHPALHLVPTMSGRVKQEGAVLRRLTEEQLRLIDATEQIASARIEGPAGTGKTVMAIERARRLAAVGTRTCLICYNRPLADAIAGMLEDDTDESLCVSTFHGLCHRAANLLGRPFEIPTDKKRQQEFWRDEAPEFLLEAADQGKLTFDAVVVDEAQDLLTEWWIAVQSLIPASAPLWVFHDPAQDIYDRAGSMPGGLVPLVLSINCRATQKLRELCDSISGRPTTSLAGAPEGLAHEEVQYKNAADLCRRLDEKVAALVKQGLHPSQMVILSPHRQHNSSLASVEHVGGCNIVTEPGGDAKEILFSTASRFKGLEADVVLLIDQDPKDPACTAIHRYVAASRARHLLVVFSRGRWVEVAQAAMNLH